LGRPEGLPPSSHLAGYWDPEQRGVPGRV